MLIRFSFADTSDRTDYNQHNTRPSGSPIELERVHTSLQVNISQYFTNLNCTIQTALYNRAADAYLSRDFQTITQARFLKGQRNISPRDEKSIDTHCMCMHYIETDSTFPPGYMCMYLFVKDNTHLLNQYRTFLGCLPQDFLYCTSISTVLKLIIFYRACCSLSVFMAEMYRSNLKELAD